MTIYDSSGNVIIEDSFLFAFTDGRTLGTIGHGNYVPVPSVEPQRKKCICKSYLSPKDVKADEWICENPNHYDDVEKERIAIDKRLEAERLAEQIAIAAERQENEEKLSRGILNPYYYFSDGYELDLSDMERALNAVLNPLGVQVKETEDYNLVFSAIETA